MSAPTMTRADLRSVYDETLDASDGNTDLALRAVFNAGRGIREAMERTRQTAEQRKARAKEQGKFLRKRHVDLFEAVAAHHGTTVERMLDKHGRDYHAEVTAIRELFWLLRNASGQERRPSFPEIGGAVERDHSSVIAAVKKTERMIAERAEYRVELLALADVAAERRRSVG